MLSTLCHVIKSARPGFVITALTKASSWQIPTPSTSNMQMSPTHEQASVLPWTLMYTGSTRTQHAACVGKETHCCFSICHMLLRHLKFTPFFLTQPHCKVAHENTSCTPVFSLETETAEGSGVSTVASGITLSPVSDSHYSSDLFHTWAYCHLTSILSAVRPLSDHLMTSVWGGGSSTALRVCVGGGGGVRWCHHGWGAHCEGRACWRLTTLSLCTVPLTLHSHRWWLSGPCKQNPLLD